jgi:hypothetical protein
MLSRCEYEVGRGCRTYTKDEMVEESKAMVPCRWQDHNIRRDWSDFFGSIHDPTVGFCEHGNGPCIHSKVWNFSKTQGVAKASSSSLQHPDRQNATQLTQYFSTAGLQPSQWRHRISVLFKSLQRWNKIYDYRLHDFVSTVLRSLATWDCNSLGDNRNAFCIKAFGFLPGVIFWSQANVSGLLVCPIFRVSR